MSSPLLIQNSARSQSSIYKYSSLKGFHLDDFAKFLLTRLKPCTFFSLKCKGIGFSVFSFLFIVDLERQLSHKVESRHSLSECRGSWEEVERRAPVGSGEAGLAQQRASGGVDRPSQAWDTAGADRLVEPG